MKQLVACPTCEQLGQRQIMGELKDGFFIVMRFHTAYTKIRGEFEVICDKCNEPVYFKTLERRSLPNGTLSDKWLDGFYWSQANGTAQADGTFSGTS